jgi:hypothetical protein
MTASGNLGISAMPQRTLIHPNASEATALPKAYIPAVEATSRRATASTTARGSSRTLGHAIAATFRKPWPGA